MNLPNRREPKAGQQRRAGERAELTRSDVLNAARRIADESGAAALSMRKIGRVLGVAPNALYTYFPSKLAIMDAVLDDLLGEVPLPDPADTPWDEGIGALMRSSRALLLRHPRLIEQFFARPGGENAWKLGERTLEFLAHGGVQGSMAGAALRALLAYTLGSAAAGAQVAAGRSPAEPPTSATERIRALPADRFPRVRAAERILAAPPDDEEFGLGLRWLLAGLAEQEAARGESQHADREMSR